MDENTNSQTIAQGAQQNVKSPKSHMLIIVAVIVVLLIIGTYFVLNNRSGKALSTISSSSSSTSSTTTIAANAAAYNITYNCFGANSTTLCHGGGPGKYYISAVEAAGLIGANGSYGVFYTYSPSGHAFNFSYFTNNVTASWYENYMISQLFLTKLVFEFVYLSPKAQYLYKMDNAQDVKYAMNKSNQQTIIAVNATIDGMTYTYITHLGTTSRASYLVGYKNNELVEVTAPYEINQTTLASVVANDLP